MIPIQCEYYALEPQPAARKHRMIQKHLNPRLHLLDDPHHVRRADAARSAGGGGGPVALPGGGAARCDPRAPYGSPRRELRPGPVIAYDPQSVGAISYREAAVELVLRQQQKTNENS